MKRNELLDKIRDAQIRLIAIQHHSEGMKKLFDAAVMCNANDLSEAHRTTLHNLLDQQLDATAEVTSLTRALIYCND